MLNEKRYVTTGKVNSSFFMIRKKPIKSFKIHSSTFCSFLKCKMQKIFKKNFLKQYSYCSEDHAYCSKQE